MVGVCKGDRAMLPESGLTHLRAIRRLFDGCICRLLALLTNRVE